MNVSLQTFTVTKSWKMVEVIPLPKSLPISINQLRPVSLQNIPMKIMEKLVLSKYKDKILKNIDNQQFGFRPMSSTTCALIQITEYITK